MLGPASFINSCCKPNCIYDFDKKKSLLRLKVIKKEGIQPNEEITVKYAGDYFGENPIFCCCLFTEYHGKTAPMLENWTRSGSNWRNFTDTAFAMNSETTNAAMEEPVTSSYQTRCSKFSKRTSRKRTFFLMSHVVTPTYLVSVAGE